MEAEQWISRWEDGRTGFHQEAPNRWLQQFCPQLELAQGETVFLPLCGKSLDLVWLAEAGFPVLGVELSPIAVRHFFEEQGVTPTCVTEPPFNRCHSGNITLLEGDFFDLVPSQLRGCSALFDRAALVALPPEMRQRYVAHLSRLLTSGSRILLVTTDFPQEQKSPPPFAVTDEEVHALYERNFEVTLLHTEDLDHTGDPLTRRGVTSLVERVYLMVRR